MLTKASTSVLILNSSMYGKRPFWQWVLIYAIIAGLIYAALYYFVLAKRGGYEYKSKPYTKQTEPSPSPQATTETAALLAVGSYKGSGTATRSFDGITFTHTVRANLGEPAKGKFYEGWLVKKKPTLTFFSTGRMFKQENEYTLTFTASQNYPEHKDVVITEETESLGLDGKPEAHVLEGSF